jgi:DNA-directed RNA polymerase specialized sigma24 family protein
VDHKRKPGQTAGSRDRFDAAAARLFEALSADPVAASTSREFLDARAQDVHTIAASLSRLLLRQPVGLSDSEAEEIAQEAIMKVVEQAQEAPASLREIRNPGAYMTTIARNRAIDHVRRRARSDLELSDELARVLPSHDDEIAALLDANATATVVREAVRLASEAQDYVALRVVSTWLDMADELGEAPTGREVGERAKVSHTTVNQALKRFASYCLSVSGDASPQ